MKKNLPLLTKTGLKTITLNIVYRIYPYHHYCASIYYSGHHCFRILRILTNISSLPNHEI